MTKPYQNKSSLLRPYFRCFWPILWPNLIFFPFSQVLPPHPTTTLVWGIQEHLSHQWKLFFCLLMLQDQCALSIFFTTWWSYIWTNCLLRCEVLPEPHDGRVAKLILQLVIVMVPASYVTILLPVNIRHVRFSFFSTDVMPVLVVGRPSQEDIVWPTHILWPRSIIGRVTCLVTHWPLPEVLLVPPERVAPRVVVTQLEQPDQPPGLYQHPQQALPYQQQYYQPGQLTTWVKQPDEVLAFACPTSYLYASVFRDREMELDILTFFRPNKTKYFRLRPKDQAERERA